MGYDQIGKGVGRIGWRTEDDDLDAAAAATIEAQPDAFIDVIAPAPRAAGLGRVVRRR